MKFKEITIKNFMPYKGEVVVKFPQGDKNILLLYGQNTYGKTSFINAIKWCLYGKAYTKSNKQYAYKDLLNWSCYDEGNYTFEVSLQFEDEGNNFTLIRKVEKNNEIDFPQTDSHFKADSFLTKNGIPYDSESEIIHQINRIAPEPVSRFFLFDGELLNQYSELLEKNSEVGELIKSSIEQILGVPSLINGKEDTAFLLRKYEKKQNQELAKSQQASDLINSRNLLNEHINELNADNNRLEGNLKEAEEEKRIIDTRNEDFAKKNEIAKDLAGLKESNRIIEKDIENLNIERLDISKNIWKSLLKADLKNVVGDELLSNKKSNDIQRAVIEDKLNEITSILNNKYCTICDNENIDQNKINKKIDDLKNKLSELDLHKSELIFDVQKIIDITADSSGDNLKSVADKINEKSIEIFNNESKIEEIISKYGDANNLDSIRKDFKKSADLATLIESIKNNIKQNNESIESDEKEINLLNEKINKDPETSGNQITKYVDSFNQLNKIFSESIVLIREKFKKEVEKNSSDLFKKLIHREHYKGLKINDNYGLTIMDDNDKEVYIKSSGAEQIVALSLIAGLAKSGRKSGPVVMDTPFGRLDVNHRENILTHLPKNSSQLVLFVHDGEVNEDMARKISNQVGINYEIVLADDKVNSYIREIIK